MREQHLDVHEVTLGVLEPDEAAAFAVLPNSNLAARLCSAYNDWLLENWLQEERRRAGCSSCLRSTPRQPRPRSAGSAGGTSSSGFSSRAQRGSRTATRSTTRSGRPRNELGLPVAVHTHFESVGISPPITAAGMPDYYVEYHTLCGAGMYGHFVSILCHGVFERFPDTRVAMVEGGLVPYVGFLWRLDTNWRAAAARSRGASGGRRSTSGSTSASQPSHSSRRTTRSAPAPAIECLRPWDTLMYASDFPHWDFDEPEQTLRQLPEEWRDDVRWRNAGRSSDCAARGVTARPREALSAGRSAGGG